MIQLVTLIVILSLYLTPLNLVIFSYSNNISSRIIEKFFVSTELTSEVDVFSFIYLMFITVIKAIINPVVYIGFIVIIFLTIYLILNFIIKKLLFIFKDIDLDKIIISLEKYKFGQKRSDGIVIIIISILIILQILLRINNIRILVLGVLIILFLLKNKINITKE